MCPFQVLVFLISWNFWNHKRFHKKSWIEVLWKKNDWKETCGCSNSWRLSKKQSGIELIVCVTIFQFFTSFRIWNKKLISSLNFHLAKNVCKKFQHDIIYFRSCFYLFCVTFYNSYFLLNCLYFIHNI